MGEPDTQAGGVAVEGAAFLPAAEPTEPGPAPQVGQREVLQYGAAQHQPLRFAIFGEQADAGADRVTRAAHPERPTIKCDRTALGLVSAEQQPSGFGAARADQAGESNDF